MAYVFLLLAITAEVLATSLLKSTEGFTRLWPTLFCLTGYGLSFVGLSKAVQTLPLGLTYALWCALGTVAIAAIGVAFLGETLSWVKVAGVILVVGGVAILEFDRSR